MSTRKSIGTNTAPRGRPKKSDGVSLKETLIQAGLELLRNESLESLSLRKVARAAGVSHAAAYRHFENKDDLFAAIAEEGYRHLYSAQQKALQEAGDDFETRFRDTGWTYVRFSLENPGYARIMFGASGLDFKMYPGLVAGSKRNNRILQEVIKLGQKRGLIKPGGLKEKTLAAFSMVHGIATLLLEGRLQVGPSMQDTELMVRSVIENAFTGMGVQK